MQRTTVDKSHSRYSPANILPVNSIRQVVSWSGTKSRFFCAYALLSHGPFFSGYLTRVESRKSDDRSFVSIYFVGRFPSKWKKDRCDATRATARFLRAAACMARSAENCVARTAINIIILHTPGRRECNSRNEHLRASITVNVGQCVFIRGETGLAKLEISSRSRPCAGEEKERVGGGGEGAREERRNR